jgi:hypothetical protein
MGCLSSAEMWSQRERRAGDSTVRNLDRQRDWLGVSNMGVYFISSEAADRRNLGSLFSTVVASDCTH